MALTLASDACDASYMQATACLCVIRPKVRKPCAQDRHSKWICGTDRSSPHPRGIVQTLTTLCIFKLASSKSACEGLPRSLTDTFPGPDLGWAPDKYRAAVVATDGAAHPNYSRVYCKKPRELSCKLR